MYFSWRVSNHPLSLGSLNYEFVELVGVFSRRWWGTDEQKQNAGGQEPEAGFHLFSPSGSVAIFG
jgi:hypothetical protein